MKRTRVARPLARQAKFSLPVKAIAAFLFIAAVLSGLSLYLFQRLKNLDYFTLKSIIVADNPAVDLSYLKGRNIFSLDLGRESENISRLYPAYNKVRMVRVLPDCLYVDFIRRKPVAIVRLYRSYSVDGEGVLFLPPSGSQPSGLPFIFGLENRIRAPHQGERNHLRELSFALNIIKEASRNSLLNNYRVKAVRIEDSSSASFFLAAPAAAGNPEIKAPPVIEIKVGQEDLKGKLNILGSLLNQVRKGSGVLSYVDLRFKEPVIKLINDKK